MVELLGLLESLSTSTSIWMYMFIFFGKIAEVTASTLRIVLINRGEKLIGSIVAFFEITLWLLVTGTVLNGFTSDAMKVVVFAIAFSLGNFLGSMLDEKLAFGLSQMSVVVHSHNDAVKLSAILKEKGFGSTIMDAKGNQGDSRYVLMVLMKRKLIKEAIAIIQDNCKNAVIAVIDIKSQKGGYYRNGFKRRDANANNLIR